MSRERPPVIDAQVHIWAADGPEFPWRIDTGDPGLDARARAHYSDEIFTAERVVAEMDAAGVDAAVFVNPAMYQGDLRFALEVARRYPGRFGIVGPVDPAAADLEETIHAWLNAPEFLGFRVLAFSDEHWALLDGPLGPVFDVAQANRLVVTAYTPGALDRFRTIVERYPDLQFVLDHLGHRQPPMLPLVGAPFGDLDNLLALASYSNVAVKATAVPSLSNEAFPFADVWPALHRILDAFGTDRVIWGTDFTRVHSLVSYADSVDYMRRSSEVTDAEKDDLMGGNLRRIFNWTPA